MLFMRNWILGFWWCGFFFPKLGNLETRDQCWLDFQKDKCWVCELRVVMKISNFQATSPEVSECDKDLDCFSHKMWGNFSIYIVNPWWTSIKMCSHDLWNKERIAPNRNKLTRMWSLLLLFLVYISKVFMFSSGVRT